jgi:hypothetical protein
MVMPRKKVEGIFSETTAEEDSLWQTSTVMGA